MQYFQFDSEGNMYVYRPGAGCSGIAKLVKPGDDLSSSWNDVEDHCGESESEGTVADSGISMSWSQRSYNSPLPKEEMEKLSNKNFSPETMKKIKWVLKMYREWRIYRNGDSSLENITCDLDDMSTVTEASLIFGVSWFITEVKKLDESDFPGKTLYDMIVCIQFHLETKGFCWRLLSNDVFKDIKFTLDNMMKIRTSQGIGVSVKRA